MGAVLSLSHISSVTKERGPEACQSPEEMVATYHNAFGQAPMLVVTNREPIIWEGGGSFSFPPGGVSQTIHRLMGQVGGEWIAFRDSSGPDLVRVPAEIRRGTPPGYLLRRVSLPGQLRDAHYAGFSNGVLWPFFHDDPSRIDRTGDFFEPYLQVNRRMAGRILESLTACPAGAIWIHDYQVALVGREIRRMAGHALPPLAFFWHIPWCEGVSEKSFDEFPWLSELVDGLLSHDHVGFQTTLYRERFLESVKVLYGESRVTWDGAILSVITSWGTRTLSLGVHPVSIDPGHFDRLAGAEEGVSEARKVLRETGLLDMDGRAVPFLISAERMDYSKGFLERLEILESLFTHYPCRIGRLSLLQIAPPTRQNVDSYRTYRKKVQEAENRLNARFRQEDGWVPVRTVPRALDQSILAPLYRMAAGALITSTRDGMNLVAKEFLASQRGKGGILFLSRYTGAAQTMEGPVQIDPFAPAHSARLIHEELLRDPSIRRRRNLLALADLSKHNVYQWMLENLSSLREASVPAEG